MDELVFAKLAQGCMCEVYYYPLELFLIAQIDQGARKETETFASFLGFLVVKVNDAKTMRTQSKCSAYDNTKKSPFVFVWPATAFAIAGETWKQRANREKWLLATKKSTVCWRRRKRQGKRNMIRTRERTDGLKESSSSTLFPSHNQRSQTVFLVFLRHDHSLIYEFSVQKVVAVSFSSLVSLSWLALQPGCIYFLQPRCIFFLRPACCRASHNETPPTVIRAYNFEVQFSLNESSSVSEDRFQK